VWNSTYKPLARPLFVYVKGSSFKRPELQAFLSYLYDNEVAIAKRAGFIPLTQAQLEKARLTFGLAVKAAAKAT
jgi:phosphate transport system substrate-binding protein